MAPKQNASSPGLRAHSPQTLPVTHSSQVGPGCVNFRGCFPSPGQLEKKVPSEPHLLPSSQVMINEQQPWKAPWGSFTPASLPGIGWLYLRMPGKRPTSCFSQRPGQRPLVSPYFLFRGKPAIQLSAPPLPATTCNSRGGEGPGQ